MDIQARKLSLIEYLISIRDEKMLSKIETLIFGKSNQTHKIAKFTEEELIDRIHKSQADYVSGNYTSQEELEKKSETW